MELKPPLPPFTLETAIAKVQAAEDAWNTRDPDRVALAYTKNSQWRNRAGFFSGRRREASINDVPIEAAARKFLWERKTS